MAHPYRNENTSGDHPGGHVRSKALCDIGKALFVGVPMAVVHGGKKLFNKVAGVNKEKQAPESASDAPTVEM